MSLESRSVSNKNISNSFRGILRISPDNLGQDTGFIGNSEFIVSDSAGNESALSLGRNRAHIRNAHIENLVASGETTLSGNTTIIGGHYSHTSDNISIKVTDDIIGINDVNFKGISQSNIGDILYHHQDNEYIPYNLRRLVLDIVKENNISLVGQIMIWGSDNIPAGWLRCDGQILSQADYPDLFSVIGFNFTDTEFVNTSVEFRIPDFRGVFLRGADRGRGLDINYSNRGIGKFQDSAVPNIWGWFDGNTDDDYTRPIPGGRKAGAFYSDGPGNIEGSNGHDFSGGLIGFDASRCSTVYKNDTYEVRPVNYSVDFIIKY